MNYDALNTALSVPVIGSWLLMAVAPKAKVTRVVLHSDVVPLVIGVVYAVIAARYLPVWFGSFKDLDSIAALLSNREVLFIGWLHYLAFDLFVGRSILADAQRREIPHLAVVPCLFLTFMFGPVGYLAYAALRVALRRANGAVHPLPQDGARATVAVTG